MIITLFALFASQMPAQAPLPMLSEDHLQTAITLREQALQSSLAYDITESLTSEVGSRLPGSAGDELAVAWGIAKFNELGFDRVTTQPVTFPRWLRGEAHAEVISPFPHALTITALGGSVATPAEGVETAIVAFESVEALEAVEDGSLQGQIAYIANRMERHRDGSGYGPAVRARSSGPQIAHQKGASALLIRSVGTSDNRIAHTGIIQIDEQTPVVPSAALSNPDADLLDRLIGRDEPVTLRFSTTSRWDGEATSHNVIGDFIGSSRPEEIVLIGCHLDSWDLGTGAIDDGAGCGITMAAAQIIGSQHQRPARTIRVVLFANEEMGLIGAHAYLAAHQDEVAQHVIGSESDFGAGRVYKFSTRVRPEALAAIDQINQILSPLGITRGDNRSGGGPDMTPMQGAGMPTARLLQDGTDYFDLHHTANDTFDKIDPQALAQNTAAWVVFSYLAAEYPGQFGPLPEQEETP